MQRWGNEATRRGRAQCGEQRAPVDRRLAVGGRRSQVGVVHDDRARTHLAACACASVGGRATKGDGVARRRVLGSRATAWTG
eukprot:3284443-Prymnesium_polylepis.1